MLRDGGRFTSSHVVCHDEDEDDNVVATVSGADDKKVFKTKGGGRVAPRSRSIVVLLAGNGEELRLVEAEENNSVRFEVPCGGWRVATQDSPC
mmetsp:Transcript_5652/g.11724  ORF Transcript_5652/g.11724 Transcript_5652/m.11724 type:complete len:93 (+) Transcript_5652:1947-2225(+)